MIAMPKRLIAHFKEVIKWAGTVFPKTNSLQKGLKWGDLYSKHGAKHFEPELLAVKVANLMSDEDVTKKGGIYAYVLGGCVEEKLLNIRAFSPAQKQTAYSKQGGLCAIRGESYPIEDMEADHIVPWVEGGKTDLSNCQMIHRDENRTKGRK